MWFITAVWLLKRLWYVGGIWEVWKQTGDVSQRLQYWSAQRYSSKLGGYYLAVYQLYITCDSLLLSTVGRKHIHFLETQTTDISYDKKITSSILSSSIKQLVNVYVISKAHSMFFFHFIVICAHSLQCCSFRCKIPHYMNSCRDSAGTAFTVYMLNSISGHLFQYLHHQ